MPHYEGISPPRHLVETGSGTTQPPLQWVPVFSQG